MKTKFETLKEELNEKSNGALEEEEYNKIIRVLDLLHNSHYPIFDCMTIEKVEIDAKNCPTTITINSEGTFENYDDFILTLEINGNNILLTDNKDCFRFEENEEMRKVTFKYFNDIICTTGSKKVDDKCDNPGLLREYILENGGYGSINIKLYIESWSGATINDVTEPKDLKKLPDLDPDFESDTTPYTNYTDSKYYIEGQYVEARDIEKKLDLFLHSGISYRNNVYDKSLQAYESLVKDLKKKK